MNETKTKDFISKMINSLNDGEGLRGHDFSEMTTMGSNLQSWYKYAKTNKIKLKKAYNLLSDNGANNSFDDDNDNILKLFTYGNEVNDELNIAKGRKRSTKSTKKRKKKRRLLSRRR